MSGNLKDLRRESEETQEFLRGVYSKLGEAGLLSAGDS